MNKKNGFTLLELIIVILLLSVFVGVILGVKDNQKTSKSYVTQKNISVEETGSYHGVWYAVFVDKTSGQRIFYTHDGVVTLREKPE